MKRRRHTVELPLEPDYTRIKRYEEYTDREEFTSASSAVPSYSSEDEEEDVEDERLVFMIGSDLTYLSDGVMSNDSVKEEAAKKLSSMDKNTRGHLETILVDSETVALFPYMTYVHQRSRYSTLLSWKEKTQSTAGVDTSYLSITRWCGRNWKRF